MSDERTGRIGQIKIYVGKLFRIFMNEKNWKLILFAVVIAGILSGVMGDNYFVGKVATRVGTFALVSACIWIGIFNSIQSICKEREIIKREHRTGLHISAYVMAHMIFQAVICAAQALIILIIFRIRFQAFPHEGLITGVFLIDLYLILFILIYSSAVLGLAVSALVHNPTAAMTVMPFVLIVELLFSGSIFTLPDQLKWASDLTISKWGMYAVCTDADINSDEDYTLWNQYVKMLDIPGARTAVETFQEISKDLIAFSKRDTNKEDIAYVKEFFNRFRETTEDTAFAKQLEEIRIGLEEAKKISDNTTYDDALEEAYNQKMGEVFESAKKMEDEILEYAQKINIFTGNDRFWGNINSIDDLGKALAKYSSDGVTISDEDIRELLYEKSNQLTYEAIYEYKRSNVLKQLGILLLFTCAYYGIAVGSLEFIDKDKR